MKKETKETTAFESYPRLRMRTPREAREELLAPCGRFKTPNEREEKLLAFIGERLRPLDTLGAGEAFVGDGFPLNWRRLVRYLYEQHVIEKPDFLPRTSRNDWPKLGNYGFALDKSARPTDGRTASYTAFGGSFSTEDAISKAIGETLERYFLSIYRRAGMRTASARSLGKRALALKDLNGFLPFQKNTHPELGLADEAALSWVSARSYPAGKRILVPAQLVFWNYKHDGERVLARGTTSGCAGHFTRDEAILAGLLELIQRDGFLIYWLNRLAPPVLDATELHDPGLDTILEYLRRYRLEVTFLDTTSDIRVPSITCVIRDDHSPESPVISVGAGTGFDLAGICRQALIEALLVNRYAAQLPTYELPPSYRPFVDETLDRNKRLGMWKGTAMAQQFAFFLAGEKKTFAALREMCAGANDAASRLATVMSELRRLGEGYEVTVYDVRDRVLDELGFHVVRTIVPKLVPLYLVESGATLDAERLRTVPQMLGYEQAKEYNPLPHPFP